MYVTLPNCTLKCSYNGKKRPSKVECFRLQQFAIILELYTPGIGVCLAMTFQNLILFLNNDFRVFFKYEHYKTNVLENKKQERIVADVWSPT